MNTNSKINYLVKDSAPSKSGYVFFDTSNPIVIWNMARGIFNTTQEFINYFEEQTFISFFHKSRIEKGLTTFEIEKSLEKVRVEKYRNEPSRLTGLFYFSDTINADLASKHINVKHFQDICLTEIKLNPYYKEHKYDMNWITFYQECHQQYPDNWQDLYWQGKICQYKNKNIPPIWECITENGFIIEDENIKYNCIERIKEIDEQLLILLYISIWAGFYGYAYGYIFYRLTMSKNGKCHYICPITIRNKEIENITIKKLGQDNPKSFRALLNLFDKYKGIIKIPDFMKFGYCLDCKTSISKCLNYINPDKEI